jgi:hypothetical protein
VSYFQEPQPDVLQQGDIYYAPVVRAESSTAATHTWSHVDEFEIDFPQDDEGGQSHAVLKAGYAPVMVLSHDCQMDRQMNAEYQRLRKAKPPLTKAAALAAVESDPDLDRFVTVAPILSLARYRTELADVKSGAVIGMFYVPPTPGGEITVDSVVDLNFVSTVDRSLLRLRTASLGESSLSSLRLALARLYALRTPEIGFELEEAVGQRIVGVRRDEDSPARVLLELKDGSEIALLLNPGPVKQGRPSAKAPR